MQTHHLTQVVYAGLAARLAGAVLVHVEHEFFSLMDPTSKRRLAALAPLCLRLVAVGEEVRELHEVGLEPRRVDVGDYLRCEFYRLTLIECGRDSQIVFGTLFSSRNVRIGLHVYIGNHCMISDAVIGREF